MAKKNKKGKVAIVIALKPMGGKNPKKPTKTADVGKGGMCGVKKAQRTCPKCGKQLEKGMCKMGCA